MTPVLRLQQQGLQWEVIPGFETLLPEALSQPGEQVKNSRTTTVTRRRVADREFYIKRYLHERRGLAPLSYFVRAAKSQREWKHAPQFQSGGVHVVPHLAHGERWGWYGLLESVLITEGLAGYEPILTAPAAATPEFQIALGRFLRNMHDGGIRYLDISPRNMLYSVAEHDFCLIDIDKAKLRPNLDEERRVRHLVTFRSRFVLTPAFFEGYGSEFSRRANEIETRAKALRQRRTKAQSRHWKWHTHEIYKRQIDGLRWYVRMTQDDAQLHQLMKDPQAFGRSGVGGLMVEEFAFGAANRAYREAYRRELLKESGPRPVAVGEKRMLGLCWRSYFVAKP